MHRNSSAYVLQVAVSAHFINGGPHNGVKAQGHENWEVKTEKKSPDYIRDYTRSQLDGE